MIVKNESSVIEDTLKNIVEHVQLSYYVINDTGSTDNTIEIIKNYFDSIEIEGEIYQNEWIDDFAFSRNQALDYCIGKSEYVLFFDADDRFNGNIKLYDIKLTEDIYDLKFKSKSDGLFHYRTLIVKNRGIVRWLGGLHEYIQPIEMGLRTAQITGDYHIQAGHFGARGQDKERALKDALILEKLFENETEYLDLKARYAFYCGSSFFRNNNFTQAIEWLKTRIEMSHLSSDINEEYFSYRLLGTSYSEMKDIQNAIFWWTESYNKFEHRLECIYDLICAYFISEDYEKAFDLAIMAKSIHYAEDVKFIYGFDYNIYQYGIDAELLKSAFMIGNRTEAFNSYLRLRQQPYVNEDIESLLNYFAKEFEK